MKKFLIGIYFFLSFINISLYGEVAVSQKQGWFSKITKSRPRLWNRSGSVVINRVTKIESASGTHACQVIFEFMNPLYYEIEETVRGEEVKLYFPGMQLADFKSNGVIEKIKNLTIIKNVALEYQKVPTPRVVLTLLFAKDVAILRLTKMEEPNFLVIDMFNKATLKVLRDKVTTILKATNDHMLKKGCPRQSHLSKILCLNSTHEKKRISPHKLTIVIDAGHGGHDKGASSFGIKEKSVTLDIARRVHALLKKEGYRAFLTRNTDTYLSVVDRFQLAQQLKADLFISVHVNAVAGVTQVSGLETHFLDGSPFFGKARRSNFIFVKNKHDKKLAMAADRVLYEKITSSKVLSSFIQNSILTCLKKKNIHIVDRGVKRTGFRTLLHSEVPSSIVEVGFLTNKHEAQRLTLCRYRSFLARGICDGIKEFLSN